MDNILKVFFITSNKKDLDNFIQYSLEKNDGMNNFHNNLTKYINKEEEGIEYTISVYSFEFNPKELKESNKDEKTKNYKAFIKLTNKENSYTGLILFREKRNNFIYDFKFNENLTLQKDKAPPSCLELDKLEQMKIFIELLKELKVNEGEKLSLDLNLDSQIFLMGKDTKYSFDFYLQNFNQCYTTNQINTLLMMFKLERVILPKKLNVEDYSPILKKVEEKPDIITSFSSKEENKEKNLKIFCIILLYFRANYEKETVKKFLPKEHLWKYYVEIIPLNYKFFSNIEIHELFIKEILTQKDLNYEIIKGTLNYIRSNKNKLNEIYICRDNIKEFCVKNNIIINVIDLAPPNQDDDLEIIKLTIGSLVSYQLESKQFLSFNEIYWKDYYKCTHNLDIINNLIRACQTLDKDLKEIDENDTIFKEPPIKEEQKTNEFKNSEPIEKKLVMPTIGNISVGKSYFLNSIFGNDFCQVKSGITTKFALFIRHIDNLIEPKLYKIKPFKIHNEYNFYKEGEVITGENNIKDKISEINDNNKKFDSPIFYMLEVEIKTIENKEFLNKVDFLDLPGLNEFEVDYVSAYFEYLKDLIKYCLIIFSVENYNSKDSIKVINNVKNNIYVPIENFLLILNKIDRINGNIEGTLHDFKKVFLNDEGFNCYRNKIVPLNSLILKSEIQIETSYYHFLNYYYLKYSKTQEDKKTDENEFLEFIQKKIRSLEQEKIKQLKIKSQNLNADTIEDIKDNTLIFIKEKKSKGSNINIDLNEKKDMIIIKFFYICFLEKYFISETSNAFKEINNYFNNIKDFSFPKLDIYNSNIEKYIYDDTEEQMILKKLDVFFKNTFCSENLKKFGNIISLLNNDFKVLNNYIHNSCLEYIPILGVSNSGKSSFINCLLQKDVLTCDSAECTRRGIIIRYIEERDKISLYSIKFKSFENLSNKYYYYVKNQLLSDNLEDIKEIIAILNETFPNNEEDSFLLIEINIKCLDEMDIKSEIRKNICIIDFPGHNTNNNLFFEKDIYQNVLKMSSFFIYINSGKAFKEEANKLLLSKLYNDVIKIRIGDITSQQFIDLSLFIFNKVDCLEENEKNLNGVQDDIKDILGVKNNFEEKISCSFFSSLLYHKFLSKKEDYKIDNIIKLFNTYYSKFKEQNDKSDDDDLFDDKEENFLQFARSNFVKKIKSEFHDQILPEQIEKEEENASTEIYKKINSYMESIHNEKKLTKDQNYEKNILDICKYLIIIKEKITKLNYYKESYASQTFEEMSNKIINSSNLKKQEYINHLERFFYFMNIFFRVESTNFEVVNAKEDFEKITKKTLDNIENIFKEFKGQKIIRNFKENIFALIDNLKCSYNKLMADNNNDIDKVISVVECQINATKQNLKNQLDAEIKKIESKIIEQLKSIGFSESKSSIDKNIERIYSTKIKVFFATLGIGALAYGLFYSLPTFIINKFKDKRKFISFLDDMKQDVERELQSISISIDKNFKSYKAINMKNARRLLGLLKAGNIKTDNYWKEAKEEYLKIFNDYKKIKNI